MSTTSGSSPLRSMRWPALFAIALLGLGTGCPSVPRTCPNCEIKSVTVTVDEYAELEDGWTIDGAELTVESTHYTHCPSGGRVPCEESSVEHLAQIHAPGTYDHELPGRFASKDTVEVSVEVTLRKGSQSKEREAGVSISSKSTSAIVRTPGIGP